MNWLLFVFWHPMLSLRFVLLLWCAALYQVKFVDSRSEILEQNRQLYILHFTMIPNTHFNLLESHIFKMIYLYVHLLPGMNVMLGFIYMGSFELRGTQSKRKLQMKNSCP